MILRMSQQSSYAGYVLHYDMSIRSELDAAKSVSIPMHVHPSSLRRFVLVSVANLTHTSLLIPYLLITSSSQSRFPSFPLHLLSHNLVYTLSSFFFFFK